MPHEIDLSATQIEQLDEALVELALGASLNDILAQAGSDATWLKPLLMAATEVKDLPPPHPLPSPDASLQQMLAHAAKLRAAPPVTARPTPVTPPASPGWWAGIMAVFTPMFRRGLHVTALTAAILIAFLAGSLLGTGAIFAAQQSLPGDPGYGLKRTLEDVQLGLAFNPARREYLMAQFNDRRRMETELLLDQGREAEIVFEDQIQAVNDQSVVMGLAISITDSTEIEGLLTPGARVRLEAVTDASGQVTAVKIVVIQPGTPAPSPTATASPSSTATASPTATATAPTQTGDTLTLPPTPTPSPQPTPDSADLFDDSPNSNVDDTSGNGTGSNEEISNTDDSENNNDSFDDSNDNVDDDPLDNNDNSDDNSGDDFNDNDGNDNFDDGSDSNNDDSSDNSDDAINDNSDDFNDDDFADDEFDDDSSNDNGDDSSSDDKSGEDKPEDKTDEDNSGSGSSNSGSDSSSEDSSDSSDDNDNSD